MTTTWDVPKRSLAIFSSAWLLGLLAACGSDEPQVETQHPAEVEQQGPPEDTTEDQGAEDNDDAPALDAHREEQETGSSARSQDSAADSAEEDRAAQFAEAIEEVFEELAGTAVEEP